MKLQVLGSSSSGNCYLLTSKEGKTLIIEAGISFREVKNALNYNISNIVGCVVSHVHSDHAGKLKEFLKAGIEVWSCGNVKDKHNEVNEFCGNVVKLGDFVVQSFCLDHDVECIGFLIDHQEMGRLVFITDTSKCTSKYGNIYKFRDVNHFMIETNYDEDILYYNILKGSLTDAQAERTTQTHLSIHDVKKFLSVNVTKSIRNIVLLHLSNNNSNAVDFTKDIKNHLSMNNVYIADRGVVLELNKNAY